MLDGIGFLRISDCDPLSHLKGGGKRRTDSGLCDKAFAA